MASGTIKAVASTASTLREIPFSISTSSWELSNGLYSTTIESVYIVVASIIFVTYDLSIRNYAMDDISATKLVGGLGVEFTTSVLPQGDISGIIYVLSPDDGRVPILIEGTTVAVANGGTGSSTAAGARTNLGLGDSATKTVINNLTTDTSGYVLDGRQGKVLSDKIDSSHYWQIGDDVYIGRTNLGVGLNGTTVRVVIPTDKMFPSSGIKFAANYSVTSVRNASGTGQTVSSNAITAEGSFLVITITGSGFSTGAIYSMFVSTASEYPQTVTIEEDTE